MKKTIDRARVINTLNGIVTFLGEGDTLQEAPEDSVIIAEQNVTVNTVNEGPAAVVDVEPPKAVKKPRVRKTKPASEKQATTEGDNKMAKSKKTKKESGPALRTINGKEVDLSRYVTAKAPGGGKSYNNGDEVATKLAGKDLDAVYAYAAKTLKVEEKELRSKYKHLNPGMQRMNLGNRLRKGSEDKKAA